MTIVQDNHGNNHKNNGDNNGNPLKYNYNNHDNDGIII